MKQLHAESAAVLSGEQEKTLSISLPQQRRREESELVVKVSPASPSAWWRHCPIWRNTPMAAWNRRSTASSPPSS
ncbi:MAG: hypothetical protein ACLT38_03545 [Akkermansia sp.]